MDYEEGLDPEELAFQRLYGPVKPATRDEAKELFSDLGSDWWIAGGWSIEAFTQVPRPHEDLDVSLWRKDIELLRACMKGRYHVWSNAGGRLLPLTDERPDLPEDAEQVWLRRHALAPWEYDLLINPDRDGRWVFRRDRTLDFALDEITWLADDGIRYMNPEMTLAYKARLDRPKDRQDLAVALPLLSGAQRTWLADMIHHLHPDHAWLEQVRR
jgi:hypothetical protein